MSKTFDIGHYNVKEHIFKILTTHKVIMGIYTSTMPHNHNALLGGIDEYDNFVLLVITSDITAFVWRETWMLMMHNFWNGYYSNENIFILTNQWLKFSEWSTKLKTNKNKNRSWAFPMFTRKQVQSNPVISLAVKSRKSVSRARTLDPKF